VTARPPTMTNLTRARASAVSACSKSINRAAPNARSFERLAARGLYNVDSPLQVAHAFLRGLAQTLDEQAEVDAMGARRLDATARRRVEQSLFGAAHAFYYIATYLCLCSFSSRVHVQ
jgi:hypothetical protein